MPEYWRDTIHFFLLPLYNFKNIGGHVPPLPPHPYSAVPACTSSIGREDQSARSTHIPGQKSIRKCLPKVSRSILFYDMVISGS